MIARKDVISNEKFWMPTIYVQVLVSVDNFCRFSDHQSEIRVLKNICSKSLIYSNCHTSRHSVNFPCECAFSLKYTCTKYELFQTCFSRIVATNKEIYFAQMTYVLQSSRIWAKLRLTAYGNFIFFKFLCIWFLILRARINLSSNLE